MLSDGKKRGDALGGCSCMNHQGIFGDHPEFPIIGLYHESSSDIGDDAGGECVLMSWIN